MVRIWKAYPDKKCFLYTFSALHQARIIMFVSKDWKFPILFFAPKNFRKLNFQKTWFNWFSWLDVFLFINIILNHNSIIDINYIIFAIDFLYSWIEHIERIILVYVISHNLGYFWRNIHNFIEFQTKFPII